MRRLVPQAALAALAGAALPLELGRFDRTLNLFSWWERGMDFGRYWTPHLPARPGAVHTLDYLAGRLEREVGAALPAGQRQPRVRPRADAASWAETWWEAEGLQGRVVALVPSSNMAIKQWPVQRWKALSAALVAEGCTPVLFLPPAGNGLTQLAGNGLAQRAGDGPAAVGTRYVGLFGPTNPEVTGPYDRALGTTLVAPFTKVAACGGCWRQFKYIDDRCAALAQGSCMAELEVGPVVDACLAELMAPRCRG